MVPQYRVGNYRIDLYFPEYKLAIECDEPQHLHPNNIEADKIRETYISLNTGCTFYRFAPYDKSFDLFRATRILNADFF